MSLDILEEKLRDYYIDDKHNHFSMIIINFSAGVILGPTSLGLVTYLIFVLLYECVIIYLNKGKGYSSDPIFRCGYICAGIFGWIVGRYITNRNDGDPLVTLNPTVEEARKDVA